MAKDKLPTPDEFLKMHHTVNRGMFMRLDPMMDGSNERQHEKWGQEAVLTSSAMVDAYRACYSRMEAAERVCEAAEAAQQFDFLPQTLDDLASGLKAKVNLLNALGAWKEKTK